MTLTAKDIKLILAWADFCVETGEGFEIEESALYDKLNAQADSFALSDPNEPVELKDET